VAALIAFFHAKGQREYCSKYKMALLLKALGIHFTAEVLFMSGRTWNNVRGFAERVVFFYFKRISRWILMFNLCLR